MVAHLLQVEALSTSVQWLNEVQLSSNMLEQTHSSVKMEIKVTEEAFTVVSWLASLLLGCCADG